MTEKSPTTLWRGFLASSGKIIAMGGTTMIEKTLTLEDLEKTLTQLLAKIHGLDQEAMERVQTRLDMLTKPQGSLGQLEVIAKQLGGIQGTAEPQVRGKAVLLMAGDHGVVEEGVSAFPQEVTPQMVYNFLRGGAAINVLSRQADAEVVCTDVGVAFPLEPEELMRKRVRSGTANIAKGPAMTRKEALQALLTGAEVAQGAIERGINVLATGDMGIGNTTPSSAIVAVFTGQDIAKVVGRGTGINDRSLAHKRAVIEKALAINVPNPDDPLDVLTKVGGLEIAAIAGAILQAAASRTAVVIDGFISTASALIAAKLSPTSVHYMIPSHGSVEPGHRSALRLLGFEPMLNLNMRLGEGTGAALSFYLIEAATRILKEMATFADAGVSEGR